MLQMQQVYYIYKQNVFVVVGVGIFYALPVPSCSAALFSLNYSCVENEKGAWSCTINKKGLSILHIGFPACLHCIAHCVIAAALVLNLVQLGKHFVLYSIFF